MISQFVGTIGSGKTYHALEEIIAALRAGKFVIANFPLTFTERMIRSGWADRFLFVPPDMLEDERGIALFVHFSKQQNFDEFENPCLVVIDEAGDLYPPDKATSETQRAWKKFFKLSRHLGYDFILIMQDESEINRTILRCMEYKIVHRKANSIFPFSLLPFTLFMHVTYWKQSRQKLKSGSTIFVKSFSKLYNTHQYRNAMDDDDQEIIDWTQYDFPIGFGNCLDLAAAASTDDGVRGRGPQEGAPDAVVLDDAAPSDGEVADNEEGERLSETAS